MEPVSRGFCGTYPPTRVGQTVDVCKNKKKFKVKITKPNGYRGNIAEGVANGMKFILFFGYGHWSAYKA